MIEAINVAIDVVSSRPCDTLLVLGVVLLIASNCVGIDQ